MNKREKEQYLREYYILKSQGKPFFPYAVLKDSVMACIVLVVIILLAVFLGAEIGPKATLSGIAVIAAMAYLTIAGALAGAPTQIDMKVAPQYQAGKEVAAATG